MHSPTRTPFPTAKPRNRREMHYFGGGEPGGSTLGAFADNMDRLDAEGSILDTISTLACAGILNLPTPCLACAGRPRSSAVFSGTYRGEVMMESGTRLSFRADCEPEGVSLGRENRTPSATDTAAEVLGRRDGPAPVVAGRGILAAAVGSGSSQSTNGGSTGMGNNFPVELSRRRVDLMNAGSPFDTDSSPTGL